MGSFVFAFLLGEMVHEWGHFLAHRFFGHQGISIHLDPFGGSRNLGVGPMPLQEIGITTATGPGLNLVAGLLVTVLLWNYFRPAYLPLILWGPVALIQEGVNASVGLLSPGSDAQWLVEWGVPGTLLVILGVFFILIGTGLISWILKRSTVLEERNFAARIGLVFLGMGFLMILRAIISAIQFPETAVKNLIPLIFALILGGIVAGTQEVWQTTPEGATQIPSWRNSLLAAGLGLGILFIQIMAP